MTSISQPNEMYSAPSKKQFTDAVVIINNKYRAHYGIPSYEQLTHEQVEMVVEGVREYLYKLEELKPLPSKDEDEDEDEDDETEYGDSNLV